MKFFMTSKKEKTGLMFDVCFGLLFTTCACENNGNKNPLQRKRVTEMRYKNQTETKTKKNE